MTPELTSSAELQLIYETHKNKAAREMAYNELLSRWRDQPLPYSHHMPIANYYDREITFMPRP